MGRHTLKMLERGTYTHTCFQWNFIFSSFRNLFTKHGKRKAEKEEENWQSVWNRRDGIGTEEKRKSKELEE